MKYLDGIRYWDETKSIPLYNGRFIFCWFRQCRLATWGWACFSAYLLNSFYVYLCQYNYGMTCFHTWSHLHVFATIPAQNFMCVLLVCSIGLQIHVLVHSLLRASPEPCFATTPNWLGFKLKKIIQTSYSLPIPIHADPVWPIQMIAEG